MLIDRYWAPPFEVHDAWAQRTELNPSRLTLIFPPGVHETNKLGYRFNEDLIYSNEEVIIVLGGSTTFGHYCKSKDSWPNLLSLKSNSKVINLSQPKADIWASFIALIDFVRAFPSLRISRIVTYDGINQNSAYGHFMRDSPEFRPEHMNFRVIHREMTLFREITDKKLNLKTIGYFILGNRFKEHLEKRSKSKRIPAKLKPLPHMTRLIQEESKFYLSTVNLMQEFCEKVLSAEFSAILEPTLFDYLPATSEREPEDHTFRRIYYRDLYNIILGNNKNIWDLRKLISLSSEHFIDFAHLTPNGHKLVSDAMFKIIAN